MLKPVVQHLYLHIPFCAKVCPYCSFYVHGGGVSKQERFVEALVREIKEVKVTWDLKTIFIGGGTPSMLSAPLFMKIQEALPALSFEGEFTLEVNPATITEKKVEAWKNAGVNRISLGVQSFRNEELKLLGRQHTAEEACQSFCELRAHGFDNLNIDLIFGLPQQTSDHWRETLEIATALLPEHISAYQLTYEEDTPFFEKVSTGFIVPNESERQTMFEMTEAILNRVELQRYEISNFSRLGKESKHNQAYWKGSHYLGFGPSAVSTLNQWRWTNLPDTEGYIQEVMSTGIPKREQEEITPEIYWKERVMLGLRTREGVLQSHFETHPEHVRTLDKLREEGLLKEAGSSWVLTERGQLVADSVAQSFF